MKQVQERDSIKALAFQLLAQLPVYNAVLTLKILETAKEITEKTSAIS